MTDAPYTADSDRDVQSERRRQVEEKGYTAEHDDALSLRELAACADARLADLSDPRCLPRDVVRPATEARAVLLAVIESAERRIGPEVHLVIGNEDGECTRCYSYERDIAAAVKALANDHRLICTCPPCEVRRDLETSLQENRYPLERAS